MLVRRSLFLATAAAVLLFQFAGASTLVHGNSAAVPAQTVTVFDFTSNICSAMWWSGAGQLPCPMTDHDARGYVFKVNNPVLEDGTTDSLPGLVVGPQNKTDGYLQGFYPEYTVQPGDHFQTVVGCANGSACFVTYRLDYRINGGAINILWKWKETNEGRVFNKDLDLSALAGKKVSFILTLLATGPATGDRAIWGHPRIVGAGSTQPTATSPGPTAVGPTAVNPTATSSASTATSPGGSQPAGTTFDFTSNICSAAWWSGAGQLPCPIADGDARGYFVKVNNPLLEDGTNDSLPGLIVGPQNKTDGYLQGFFPEYTVQAGDHFQTVVGCAHGSSCFVTYRLDYRINGGAINILWKWKEANEGRTFNEDFDLSALAGKKVSFILTMLATGSPVGDRAIWGHPRIVRAGFVPPTATSAPTSSGFLTYTNAANSFQFNYPSAAVLSNQTDNAVHMALPIVAGTNLSEKYLDASAVQTSGACSSGMQGGTQSQVSFNGISFLKETGEDGGAGQFHDWTAYSTARGNTCVTLMFVLHWSPANNFDPPKPVFDAAAESAVFDQMMATFTWLTQQPAGSVTNVTVAANPIFSACGGPNVVDFSGTITTNGAADVTYHWEVGGDATAGTPDQQLVFSAAGTQSVNTDAFKANCGSYLIRLVVSTPNSFQAQVNFTIGTQTPTSVPVHTATPTRTSTPTSIPPTSIAPTSVPPTSVPPPAGTNFDFTSNICAAKWWSGAGQLACPMTDGASAGYAVAVNNPLLENGTTDSLPGLVVGPQNKTDGYIQGFYPDYTIQPGDHFQAAVGCANGSSCFVTYRLDYRINGGAINILWSWKEANDNKTFNEDFDLSALAGKKVSFILTLLAAGSASGDRAIWGHPRIVVGTFTPPTATKTAIPAALVLRGKVNLELVSCRYGPGAMYLYLYGLRQGAVQDVTGRTDTGAWVLTRAHGDNKSCWVNASYLDLNDDVMKLPMVYPDKYTIPPSNQGYRAPWDVAGVRVGDQVVIDFKTEERRPGDQEDANSVLYLIETWVCRSGRLVFTPIGSFTRQVNVTDEAGCSEPSHGRVYFAEKHGYTGPSTIPWPAAASTGIQVFFYQNEIVVPVQRSVAQTDVPQAALIKLFEGPTAAEQAQGLTLITDGIIGFSSLTIADGIATVNLTGNCDSGGSAFTIAALIRSTLLQFPQVQHVRVYDQNGNTQNADPATDSIPACLGS